MIKTTRKELKDNFMCCAVDYSIARNLLRHRDPIFCTYGVYGCNFKGYIFNDRYCITAGNRNLIDDYKTDSELVKELDVQAKEIWADRSIVYKDARTRVDNLISIFLAATFEDNNR